MGDVPALPIQQSYPTLSGAPTCTPLSPTGLGRSLGRTPPGLIVSVDRVVKVGVSA